MMIFWKKKKNENPADSDKYVNSTREVEGIFKNQKCVVYLGVAITEGVSNYYSKFTTGLHHINFKGFENSIYYSNKIDWKLFEQ